MIASENEAKAMTEQISCDYKCKFISTICNSKEKYNKKTCPCECKNYPKCKKGYSRNSSTCVCENSQYLKSTVDTWATEWDEIIIVMVNVS